MPSRPKMPVLADAGLADANPILLEALASLNQIGAVVNRIGPRENVGIEDTLRLIVQSATKVVPGSSAVIYTYNWSEKAFELDSRVSAGELNTAMPNDLPRPNGMGMRCINQRRRVLSYEDPALSIHPAKVEAGAQAVVCFPLEVAQQMVGVLYVYLHQDRRFSQLELLLLENFVNQAAMAISHTRRFARVQRHLARKDDEFANLSRAGLLISSRMRLEETLETILQMAMDVTGAQYGSFRLVDKSGENLVSKVLSGEHLSQSLGDLLPIDASSVTGWAAMHRKAVLIDDRRSQEWKGIYRPPDPALEMRSELAVPLIGASGRLEGVINLESPTVAAFSQEDSQLLQALATQAVIAIQVIRLLDALQEVAERLLAQPCYQVLGRLIELAGELLDAAAAAIWILDGDELVLQVASDEGQTSTRIPLENSYTGQAIKNRHPVFIEDLQADSRFARPELARERGWTRALIVPMMAGDEREPVGAFTIYFVRASSARLVESEWNKKVLTCLAHYAALAVQNEEHQQALRAAQEQRSVAEAFAAMGDIAANVLHHLNNKVGTIPVRIQGIQDKCRPALLSDAYLATNLTEIELSACEAMEVLRTSFSQLHPIQRTAMDIATCARAGLDAANLPAGIRVQFEGLDDLPAVVTGRRSLTMVFANLLTNAANAIGNRGVVTIRGSAQADFVSVRVSDDGPGIAPELQDRVFEFDYSGRIPERPGSLGFGLWWVKMLMIRLGGSVTVESDGRHGTTFRLKLPRAGAEA